jgi:energy-coupling factor transport system ATP-binding protein
MTPDALIAAGILPKLGIREPLYATALKYAGVKITEEMGACRMETLQLPMVRDQLISWNAAQKPAPAKEEKPPILEVRNLHFQ